LVILILSLLHTQHERSRIHGLFGRFVAVEVVNEIIAGNVSVQLGGVLREVSVVFVDIRGFTAFSEANPPEKVVEMVNRYLDLTSRSIQQNGGTIDKYIGDATMAVFNAPNDLENHPFNAVKAAWDMKQGSTELQREILEEFGVDLQFGIGVNCGQAIVGNMGSSFRMDYTVIGDTVNTAARLESNASKGQIIISDAVYQQVKNRVTVNDLGEIMVKNKKDGIHIYEVIGVGENHGISDSILGDKRFMRIQ
jgi:adenylate cyclase